jgi:hypothetical protein
VLDVHAPHESVHSWRDFFLHLVTITIGLFIALSLEGFVEWQHHRHLAHDAETSLRAEIKSNAEGMDSVLTDLHQRQATLKHDVKVLQFIVETGKNPPDQNMKVDFRIVTFDDVSWKTAQTTGALSYMPYDLARDYSGIYAQQDILTASELQAGRDSMIAIGPFIDAPDDRSPPSKEDAKTVIKNIEVLQGQLILVDSYMQGLNVLYKKFLADHPA